MNDNGKPMKAAEQIRSYYKLSHKTFSRLFKAQHDETTIELLSHIKQQRHLLFVHGVNPAQTDELLKKYGV